MRSLGVMFTALVLAAGCKKDPPVAQPAPEPTPAPAVAEPASKDGAPADLVATFERAMALVEAVVVAAEAAEGDCDKVAANLAPIADGPEAGAMLALDAESERLKVHGDAVIAPHQERVQALFDRLFAQIIPCQQHSGVIGALARLGLAGQEIDEPEGE